MSSNLKVNTILPSAGTAIGIGTAGGNLNVDGGCKVQVGTALTLGHTQGLQFHTQNLHAQGFEVNQVNASGIITATGADINGDIDVDGHTNLDNVSIAGVTTITGSGNALEIVGGLVRSRNTAAARFVANNGSAEGYFGWSSGVLTVGQAAATLSLEATSSNHIQLKTNGSERLRIKSNGNIVLGSDGTNSELTFSQDGTSGVILYSTTTGFGGYNTFTVNSAQFVHKYGGNERLRIDSNGRLLTGGATTSHGSNNADDLQIGANNQVNQTGITLGSASASSIRFADAADDTAGAIYYAHGDDIMRFYAGSNQRFTVSGSTATASASIMTATIFRSGGPGGGLGITMGGLAAGSGSSWVDTGISVNASNGGRTMMILGSRNTGAGYNTQAYMWLIRFAYDGNNLPSVHNVTGNSSFWSIRVSGSNTLEINGNSGNWQFGGVYVN